MNITDSKFRYNSYVLEKKCLIPVIICKTVYILNLSQAMMIYG